MKTELRKVGYNLGSTDDPIYVMKPRTDTYEQLDAEYQQVLASGKAGY